MTLAFVGWNNATDARTSLETVLGVPRTLNFADVGYYEGAISRPSGIKKSEKSFDYIKPNFYYGCGGSSSGKYGSRGPGFDSHWELGFFSRLFLFFFS